jgi:hypothetical protein
MGKRNLALVGTNEDYFADMFDEHTGLDPSIVTQCASAEDAATSYFGNVFRNSNAHVRSAIVAVWPMKESQEQMSVFDMLATMTPCLEPDAEPGEFDVTLTAVLR